MKRVIQRNTDRKEEEEERKQKEKVNNKGTIKTRKMLSYLPSMLPGPCYSLHKKKYPISTIIHIKLINTFNQYFHIKIPLH